MRRQMAGVAQKWHPGGPWEAWGLASVDVEPADYEGALYFSSTAGDLILQKK